MTSLEKILENYLEITQDETRYSIVIEGELKIYSIEIKNIDPVSLMKMYMYLIQLISIVQLIFSQSYSGEKGNTIDTITISLNESNYNKLIRFYDNVSL
jgi:hypothetical protein